MPARMGVDGAFHKLNIPDQIRIQRGAPLRPLNLGQQCFLDALLNPEITLVTCYGSAGTGKTLLAVASALHATFNGEYNGVTVSRPVIPLGDTLGFLPGSLEEKLDPWLKPVYDALEFLLTPEQGVAKRKQAQRSPRKGGPEFPPAGGGKRSYDPFLESGLIEIEALCYIRGRSIPNRFFILDEAQQLTPLKRRPSSHAWPVDRSSCSWAIPPRLTTLMWIDLATVLFTLASVSATRPALRTSPWSVASGASWRRPPLGRCKTGDAARRFICARAWSGA